MRLLQALLLLLAFFCSQVSAEAQDPALISRIGRGTIDSVQWHPDGSYIMVTTPTGVWLYTPDLKDLAYIPAYFAQLSPDAQTIAGVDENGKLALWHAKTFERIEAQDISGLGLGSVSLLRWSPDSHYIIIAGYSLVRNKEMTIVWYLPPNEEYFHYDGAFNNVLWSPSGRYLAVLNWGQVTIFDTSQGNSPNLINYRLNFVSSEDTNIIWDDETHFVVSGPDPTENFWFNVETKETHILPYTSSQFARPSTNPAGTIAISINFDGFAIRENENPGHVLRFPYEENFPVAAWDHRGAFLAAGEDTSSSSVADIRIINLQTFEVIEHLEDLSRRIDHLLWSPDDRFLLAVDANQQLLIYDTRTWSPRAFSLSHTTVGVVLAWNPDDMTQFALADTLGNLVFWDIAAAQQEKIFLQSGPPIRQIKWQPYGPLVATLAYDPYGHDSVMQVLDPNSAGHQTVRDRFQGAGAKYPAALDWSPMGDQLAVMSNQTLFIWDKNTNTLHQNLLGEFIRSVDLAWSPDEKVIVFVSDEMGRQSFFYTLATQRMVWGAGNEEYGLSTWMQDNTWVALTWSGQHRGSFVQPHLSRFIAPFDIIDSAFPQTSAETASPTSFNELVGLTTNPIDGFISSHGRYAAAVDDSYDGMIWDTVTAQPLAMLADTANIVWSPDETLAMIQRTDGTVWLLSGAGQILAQIPTLVSTQEPSGTFFWSPDGQQVAYLHDGVVETWRAQ